MAFKRGICPACGREIGLPEEAERSFCPECGADITAEEAFRLADEAGQAAEPQSETQPQPQLSASAKRPQPQAEPTPQRSPLNPFNTQSVFQRTADTPFLAQWKTDVPFTFLGLLLRFMIIWTVVNLTGGQEMVTQAMETGVLAVTPSYIIGGGLLDLACAIAAFVIVPKRFRTDYAGRNYLVSFANTLVGGVIFGPYWNSRLTKRRMGVSHLVYFVLLATNGLSSLTMMLFM